MLPNKRILFPLEEAGISSHSFAGGLRPAAAGVAKLAARDAQLRVQMLLF